MSGSWAGGPYSEIRQKVTYARNADGHRSSTRMKPNRRPNLESSGPNRQCAWQFRSLPGECGALRLQCGRAASGGRSLVSFGNVKRTILITVIGMLAFACVALAQPRPDATLFAAARKALPQSISTNEISRALDTGLWNSNRTAVAICFTNSKASTVFVFLKQTGGKYLAVDASVEGLGIGLIGIAPRSAYERLELTPVQWLHRDDGMFMVLMRTRAWKAGQRYTVSTPLLIRQDGTILRQ
jgi:hypothetical protein